MCTIRLKFLHVLGHVCICMRARARVLCTSYIEILLCSSFEIERNLELLINDESHRLTYIFNFFDFKEKKKKESIERK